MQTTTSRPTLRLVPNEPAAPTRSAEEAGREACEMALDHGILAALDVADISVQLRRDLEACVRALRAAAGLPLLRRAI